MNNKAFLDTSNLKIFRSSILYFTADPSQSTPASDAMVYFEDGLLLVKDTHILDVGEYQSIIKKYALHVRDICTERKYFNTKRKTHVKKNAWRP